VKSGWRLPGDSLGKDDFRNIPDFLRIFIQTRQTKMASKFPQPRDRTSVSEKDVFARALGGVELAKHDGGAVVFRRSLLLVLERSGPIKANSFH